MPLLKFTSEDYSKLFKILALFFAKNCNTMFKIEFELEF